MRTVSGDVAEERALSTAAPEWVVFACDGHWFALPIGRVREILPSRPFTRLPGCPDTVCGLVGLRGRVVTAFDFGAALGLSPAGANPDHRLLLVEHGERVVAVAVGAVVGVASSAADGLAISADALKAVDIEREDLIGIGELNDRPFVAVDPDRILMRLLP